MIIKLRENNEPLTTVIVDLPEEMSDAIYSLYDNVNTYEIENVLSELVELAPYEITVSEEDVTLTNVPKSRASYVHKYVEDYLNLIWEDILENNDLYDDEDYED